MGISSFWRSMDTSVMISQTGARREIIPQTVAIVRVACLLVTSWTPAKTMSSLNERGHRSYLNCIRNLASTVKNSTQVNFFCFWEKNMNSAKHLFLKQNSTNQKKLTAESFKIASYVASPRNNDCQFLHCWRMNKSLFLNAIFITVALPARAKHCF